MAGLERPAHNFPQWLSDGNLSRCAEANQEMMDSNFKAFVPKIERNPTQVKSKELLWVPVLHCITSSRWLVLWCDGLEVQEEQETRERESANICQIETGRPNCPHIQLNQRSWTRSTVCRVVGKHVRHSYLYNHIYAQIIPAARNRPWHDGIAISLNMFFPKTARHLDFGRGVERQYRISNTNVQ